MDGEGASATGRPLMDPSGFEAFGHGVFAIAVTLLVLDIQVPDAGSIDSGAALIDALAGQAPRYAAYCLGFLFLGEYWIATNRTNAMLRGVDHVYVVLGLLFLMVIAAVPFAAALLAEYIGLGSGRDKVALVVFVALQLGLAVLANIMIRYAAHGRRLIKPTVPAARLRNWLRVAALGPLIWLVALLAAILVSGTVTLVLMAVLAIVFLLDLPTGTTPDGSTSGTGEAPSPNT